MPSTSDGMEHLLKVKYNASKAIHDKNTNNKHDKKGENKQEIHIIGKKKAQIRHGYCAHHTTEQLHILSVLKINSF